MYITKVSLYRAIPLVVKLINIQQLQVDLLYRIIKGIRNPNLLFTATWVASRIFWELSESLSHTILICREKFSFFTIIHFLQQFPELLWLWFFFETLTIKGLFYASHYNLIVLTSFLHYKAIPLCSQEVRSWLKLSLNYILQNW